jgi:transcriptional regulator with XRE-family HTH domain
MPKPLAPIHHQVAETIKLRLKERRISADRLSLEIGMSRGYFYEILTGKKRASLDTLYRIAEGLELKVKDLMPD